MSRRAARALAGADLSPLVTLPSISFRPAFLAEAIVTMELRCRCPTCLALDARYPNEGYQLALFPYERSMRPRSTLLSRMGAAKTQDRQLEAQNGAKETAPHLSSRSRAAGQVAARRLPDVSA